MSTQLDSAGASSGGKIKTIPELAGITEVLRRQGVAVVLAHGTFDLLHLGHVKHLEAAKHEGQILVVTITADEHVHKGPGRPIFSHFMRAEMLASLECVDYVGINHAPSSENVLQALRPSIYVKGSDYINPDDDVTGKIVAECQMVEKHGGRVVFTNEITLSSSSLINRYMDVFDPNLRQYLDHLGETSPMPEILAAIEKVKDFKVLIIGDTIIDEYRYVSPLGKPSKENIISTNLKDCEVFAGGVIAAANHLASFCRQVEVVTCLGTKESYEDLVHESLSPNVSLWALSREGMPTTHKCRFVDSSYIRKLFEVYTMDDSPLSTTESDQLIAAIREKAKDADVVIVNDFGHGMLTQPVIDMLVAEMPFLAVNTQTNSGNHGFNLITKYKRADYVCIDAPEAQLAVGDKYADVATVAGKLLPEAIDCKRLIVTNGRHGCMTYSSEDGLTRIPAFTKSVVDTVGAGDAFFVITTPLVAAGARMEHVGVVGNIAGAVKVGIIGHRQAVTKSTVLKYLQTLLK